MARKAIKKPAKPKPPKPQPKEDFNQAAFRAIQETLRIGEDNSKDTCANCKGR